MRKESINFLKKILTTPSPSGYESKAQKIWCDYVSKFADEITTDAYGNAVAVVNPGKKPRIIIEGHMDEIGLMVKHITDKGFIYIQNIGGVDPGLIRGKRVNIHSEKGIIRGVIGATAIHLTTREDRGKALKMHKIFIDIGATNGDEAKELVCVGDPITFVDDFEMLNDKIAIGRALDDRIGCWIAAEVLREASRIRSKLKCSVYAVSSIQEETGCNGASMNVFNIQPDAAIIAEVTHATDTPGIDVKQHGEIKLGKGPSVSIGREHHPILVKKLRKAAEKKDIPYQIETFSTSGGTDAMSMWTKNGGTPATVLGLPLRYMHTTVESMNMNDLDHSISLLNEFLKSIKKNEEFKVKVQ